MYVCCSSNWFYTRKQVARVVTGVVNPLGFCPFYYEVFSNISMHTIVSLWYSGHRSASLVCMICITISICTPGLRNTVSNNIHKVYFDCLIVRGSGSGGLFYLPPDSPTSPPPTIETIDYPGLIIFLETQYFLHLCTENWIDRNGTSFLTLSSDFAKHI